MPDSGNENKVLAHSAEQIDEATEKYLSGSLADKAVLKQVTLSTNWIGDSSPYTQVVTIDGTTVKSKVDIQPSSAVIMQMAKNGTIALHIDNEDGVLVAKADGEKPAVELTIQATITEVSV